VKASFIAGLPVLLIGALAGANVIDLSRGRTSFRAWEIIAAPLSYLPQAWWLGLVGGKVGQQITRVFANFQKGGSGLMKRSLLPVAYVLAAPMMVVGFQTAPSDTKAVQPSVEKWLSLVDTQSYAASWDEASSGFRGAVTRDQWQAAVSTARAPLGPMKSRELRTSRATTSLRGAPPGQYMVFEFDTVFAQQQNATETVTAAREQDGTWRVVGYVVK
jgi:hypothetical protein